MDWSKLVQAILQTEENIIPIVLPHPDPKQNKIVGVILASEAAAAAILAQFGVIPAPPTPPAQQ